MEPSIKERNRAIAEFMGMEILEPTEAGFHVKHNMVDKLYHGPNSLLYHSSWDWLLPACKKMSDELEKLWENKDFEDWPLAYLFMEDELLEFNIKGVFKNLSDLCKWYSDFVTHKGGKL